MTPELFIRKICHDLRAPLRALKEMPDWLEEDLSEVLPHTPAHISETTRMLKTQASRLDAMLHGLSQLARLNRSESQPSVEISSIFHPHDWPHPIEFTTELNRLNMEAEHARLALHHLVENAFRHGGTQGNRVRLHIGALERETSIRIEDTGPGVDAEDLEQIFEPLTTLHPRDEMEGSGMGLAIVARIAELYGGDARAFLPAEGGLGVEMRMKAEG